MLITLRLPKAGALRLNLGSGSSNEELTVTLTAVELAGRLTLAAGKPIGPEAVVRYCSAWQAAMAASSALANKHGPDRLAEILQEGCRQRSLWVPARDEDVLLWLQYVLLAHFLSSGGPETDSAEKVHDWASDHTAEGLADLCKVNFPSAYCLWVQGEVTADSTDQPRP